MEISEIVANELCRLLHEAGVKIGYFCGENLNGRKRVDYLGNKFVAIIEPFSKEIPNMVPHWSIAVGARFVRIDVGGIGRFSKNPLQTTIVDIADPALFSKVVNLVKNLPTASACYNLLNELYERAGVGWADSDDLVGNRTSHVSADSCKSTIRMIGNLIEVNQQYSLCHDTTKDEVFNWDDYTADNTGWVESIIAVLRKHAEIDAKSPEKHTIHLLQFGGVKDEEKIFQVDKNSAFVDTVPTIATKSEYGEWQPAENYTEEDVRKSLQSMEKMVDRFHRRKEWVPGTILAKGEK